MLDSVRVMSTSSSNMAVDDGVQIDILKNEVSRLRKLLHSYVHNGGPGETGVVHDDILARLERFEKENKSLKKALEETNNSLRAERCVLCPS